MATKTKKRKILPERQEQQKEQWRDMSVCKADSMIQKGRHQLSARETKAVAFAISKIKPTDTVFEEYTFDIKDFYKICGIQTDSYNEVKAILNSLADRGWDIPLKNDPNVISRVRWFSTLRTNNRGGKVTIKFHEDMMPYLLEVAGNEFYTTFCLRYILPMNSQYGMRLYEILKSYQKNNMSWFFEVNRLKWNLDAENYKNFADFKRFALDPAVNDINDYTDLNVAYKTERGSGRGRPIERVIFYMYEKKPKALREALRAGDTKLDGELDPMDVIKVMQEDEEDQKIKAFHEAQRRSE